MTSKKEVACAVDQDFYARQQERTSRRLMIAEREERVNKALMTAAAIVFGFVFLYLLMFYAAL